MRRIVATVFALSLLVPLFSGAEEAALTQPACSEEGPAQDVFKDLGPPNVLENLAFAPEGLWVSNSRLGQIQRFDASGMVTLTVAVPSPGAITVRGTDLYVNSGNGAAQAVVASLPGSETLPPALVAPQGKVYRFPAASPPPSVTEAELYASGLNMANGAVFDAVGTLYVSNDFDDALAVIPPGGGSHTTIDVWGTNGLVATDSDLYAAITFDQRSPIVRIPLTPPQTPEVLVQLSLGVLSLEPGVHADPDADAPLIGVKGLDDMTLGPDGKLYVTANGTGELIRVDLDGSGACLVASGLRNPSSVRFAPPGFGGYGGDAFVTEFSGRIVRIDL